MRETILRELEEVERERGVRVLLAVESGSRAWGMASQNSDYDVRFVYVRPTIDYLRLESSRDTIEWKLDEVLDICGWDLAKFLRLARKSNPTVFEWLSTSAVYAEADGFARVREVVAGCFSPKASAFHYLGMERGHDRAYLRGPRVGAKKYLYVIRALLAARWCLEEQTPAPTPLADLVDAKLPESLLPVVSQLLEAKAAGDERCEVPRIAQLDEWIEQEDCALYELARAARAPANLPWQVLDDLFYDLVNDGADEWGRSRMACIDKTAYLAHGAVVTGDVSLGARSSVWHNAVLRGDVAPIAVGAGSNVQDCAVLHGADGYPVEVGDGVTIGHGAIVHGCTIGNNTLVGMGAIVLNGAKVGRDCIVGAGALVTQGTVIPDGSVAFGSPARVVRAATEEDREANRANALEYVRLQEGA